MLKTVYSQSYKQSAKRLEVVKQEAVVVDKQSLKHVCVVPLTADANTLHADGAELILGLRTRS